MSDSIYLYQSVSFSALLLFVECVSSQSVPLSSLHLLLPLPTSSLSFSISIWDPSTTFDMQHFFSVFTVTSAQMLCHAVLIHWHRRVTLSKIVLLAGVAAQFPPKTQSPSIFFIILWGACSLQYLILAFLRYPASVTTWSVFMEHHICFMVLNALNPYNINVYCFVRSTPCLLFHTTANQFFISSLVFPSFRLASDSDSSR